MDFRMTVDKQVFGVRATALIIKDNAIFLIEREGSYYTIGGAVQVNETSQQAVLRELKEELGVTGKIKDLAFVVENHFTVDKRNFHNIEFHYIIEPLESLPTFAIENTKHYPCHWVSLDDLDKIDLNPAFLKEELANWQGQVKHIIHKEERN